MIRGHRLHGKRFPSYAAGPKDLFVSGAEGFWYDPSDFSTLFQDSAGTTPVTAVGQSVGMVLDKSMGLALGPELVTNGDFSSSAGWTLFGDSGSISGGVATLARTSTYTLYERTISVVAGATYQVSFWSRRLSGTGSLTTNIRTASNTGGTVLAAFTNANPSGDFVKARGIFTATTTGLLYIQAGISSSAAVGEFDNISVREIAGNHLVQATAASRGILRQDSSGKYYIEFDGTDDGYASVATVNFSATDEITVFAGVRKNSDAATGIICELGTDVNSVNGSFALTGPGANAAPSYRLFARGTATVNANAATGYAAPTTNVLTGIGDISGDSCILRVNGTQAASSSSDQGTGNYGNYTLYVGRRGGTTLPFNGRLYQLIGVGKLLTNAQIVQTERFVAYRTGLAI